MPVVKGGVWTNIEDEILKAAVSKYGLNQWARVSSLLARKTPKQCKARWTEWLDPGIRKIEWSKEEDEKLLHLAKLMPTQWRTIAPIVGRTATQCLERYQKLLDEAEARENDELGLGGPGVETSAPTGDDVRKLRPGEVDPDPESKPARPDTIDLDEDEKEMLSEARARLANTQGKKAKRKARERQLEESRRLAVLQKRRELKNAGINLKITNRKKGQMDYNADIPFEKPAAPGFYDTTQEIDQNEQEREAFDPRKQQLARKRQGDQDESQDPKRQKQDKDKAAAAAAARAGQMQKIREAEQQGKRRALNLPAPQVSEAELEEIVKTGLSGERAAKSVGDEEGQELMANYSSVIGATPIRTPRAAPSEDRIANEIRNIRALTETQSSLLGGENTPLHQGAGSTGFEGIVPRRHDMVTPNPMVTPLRQPGLPGQAPSATPLRTPRDNFAINESGQRQLVAQTPRDQKLAENLARQSLRAKLSSLPKPKAYELEINDEDLEAKPEDTNGVNQQPEDQDEVDRRVQAARDAAAQANFRRQSQAYQRSLPRPQTVDLDELLKKADTISDPVRGVIAREAATIMAYDAHIHPIGSAKVSESIPFLDTLPDFWLTKARDELASECNAPERDAFVYSINIHLRSQDPEHADSRLPSHIAHSKSTPEHKSAFDRAQSQLLSTAEGGNKLEKKLSLLLGGYQGRQKALKTKLLEVFHKLHEDRVKLDSFRALQINEDAALLSRLEGLRSDVSTVMRREREEQQEYRKIREEIREVAELQRNRTADGTA